VRCPAHLPASHRLGWLRITQLLSTAIAASASLRMISLLKIGRSSPKMSGWPAIAGSVIAWDGVSSWLGGGYSAEGSRGSRSACSNRSRASRERSSSQPLPSGSSTVRTPCDSSSVRKTRLAIASASGSKPRTSS
jgi:hypothetical protein